MLATAAELEADLGLTFDTEDTARAERVLAKASAMVDAYCNLVAFERVNDDQVTLPGTSSVRLHLPRGPVHDVTSVTIDGSSVNGWSRVPGIRDGGLVRDAGFGGPSASLVVTYSHGFDAVPDDVREATLKVAARLWVNPEQVMQKRFDDHSVSFGSSIAEVSRLQPDEKHDLARYRRI